MYEGEGNLSENKQSNENLWDWLKRIGKRRGLASKTRLACSLYLTARHYKLVDIVIEIGGWTWKCEI